MRTLTKVLAMALALCLLSTSAFALTTLFDEYIPLVEEKTELTFWTPRSTSPNLEDFDTNASTLIMEQLTNVHINWIQVPEGERVTEFNLSIAQGNYPDAYMGPLSTDDILTYAGDVFIPIEQWITPAITPNLCRIRDEMPSIRTMLTAPDGHIYTFFYAASAPHMLSHNKMFVYKPWLDAYIADGGKVPETTTEFEAMLVYFRDHDMNGNGIMDDEMPLVSCTDGWATDPLGFLMCAYQIMSFDYELLMAQDGVVSAVTTTDAFRDGLRWMNHLYEEGLLMEETYTQDVAMMKSLVNKAAETDRIVGVYCGAWQGVYQNSNVISNDLYVPLAPLQGPTGLRQAPVLGGELSTFELYCGITVNCENPELVMRYLDLGLAEYVPGKDFYIEYGQAEVNFYWATEEEGPSLNGHYPYRVDMPIAGPNAIPNNTRWLNKTMPYLESSIGTYSVPFDGSINQWLIAAHEVYQPYYTDIGLPRMTWSIDADTALETSELKTSLTDATRSYVAQFVTGVRDIDDDAEWNAYLREIDNLGMERYIELRQQAIFGN